MKAVVVTWMLALLIGCATVPDNGLARSTGVVASEPPDRESLHDLVVMAATASLAEVEAFLGPVPEGVGPIRTKAGPFRTGRSALIEKASFYRSGDGWDINFVLLGHRISGCFSMDDLPEAVGAEEYFPFGSEPRRFRLVRGDGVRVEFDSFPGRFSYNCLRSVTLRDRSR